MEFGNKNLPKMIDIKGPKGQIIPNAGYNLEYFISKSQFEHLYLDEKLTYPQIIELIKFEGDSSTFCRLLKKNGWTPKRKPRHSQVNVDFFKNWNEGSAWLYGWVITDGHVNKKYLDITVQSVDSDLVKKVKSLLGYSGELYESETKKTIRIHSRDLVESLYKLGIPEKDKTFNCRYPEIDPSFENHFLRGAFEGDGSLYNKDGVLNMSITGASEQFLMKYKEVLEKNGIQTKIRKRGKRCLELFSPKLKDALKWAILLYQDAPYELRLDRKYNKLKEYVMNFYSKPRKCEESISLIEELKKYVV